MTVMPKITEREWRKYVEQEMYRLGFTLKERQAIRAAFEGDLHDAEYGEKASFFEHVKPGISEEELKATMNELRDKNSVISRGLKIQLDEEKIDSLEKILRVAVTKNVGVSLF